MTDIPTPAEIIKDIEEYKELLLESEVKRIVDRLRKGWLGWTFSEEVAALFSERGYKVEKCKSITDFLVGESGEFKIYPPKD